jgi:hypothetical protein
VDEDDGSIDQATDAALSHSIFHSDGGQPLRLGFDAEALGRLPTHVGLVLTDYNPGFDTLVEVYGAHYRLLGKKRFSRKSFAADVFHGAPDAAKKARFLGAACVEGNSAGGISLLVLTQAAADGSAPREKAGIEIDHIQYGFAPPATGVSAATSGNHGAGAEADGAGD